MKIRVGSTKYDVTKYSDHSGELGRCSRDDMEIRLNTDFRKDVVKQSLWHEITHAILFEMGECDLSHDERFVEGFSRILYAFHEDNKLDKIYANIGG